jgi:hypothetical protein
MPRTAVLDLLTPTEASSLFRCSLNTLRAWSCDRGSHGGLRVECRRVPTVRLGGKVLYDRADLIALIDAGRQ